MQQQQRTLSGAGTSTSASRPQQRFLASKHRICGPRAAAAGWSPSVALPSPAEELVYLGRHAQLGDRYIEGSPIGKGSFGYVYRVVDQQTGQEYAVKRLPTIDAPGRGSLTRGKIQEKIAKEISVLQMLSGCDRVGQLHDYFDDGTDIFLVLELCHGSDLQRVSEAAGALSERAVRLVANEVLHVLKACHDLGLIYGDVKPANFSLKHKGRNPLFSADPTLLQQGPWLKALDFGCSQRYGMVSLSKRTGTPVYMAPEVFMREYTTGADMWSVGVLLYQLFTGGYFPFWRTPGCAKASKLDEVADAVSNNEITYDSGPFLGMSAEGLDFVQRCLTRLPRDRITVDQALAHPWLTAGDLSGPPTHNVPIPSNAVTASWSSGGSSSSSECSGSGLVLPAGCSTVALVGATGVPVNNILPSNLSSVASSRRISAAA